MLAKNIISWEGDYIVIKGTTYTDIDNAFGKELTSLDTPEGRYVFRDNDDPIKLPEGPDRWDPTKWTSTTPPVYRIVKQGDGYTNNTTTTLKEVVDEKSIAELVKLLDQKMNQILENALLSD